MVVRRLRRGESPRKPAVVEEELEDEEVTEEEIVEEDEEEEVGLDETDFVEEDEEEAPVVKRGRGRPRKVEAPVKAVAKKTAPVLAKKVVRTVAKAVVEEDEEEDEEPKAKVRSVRLPAEDKVATASVADLGSALLEVLDAGQSLMLRKVGSNYAIYKVDANAFTAKGKRGRGDRAIKLNEFFDIAYSDEFKAWINEWTPLTYEEKVALAKKEGVEWENHETAKIDVMRISEAMREKRGVAKWRPEYESKAARDALMYNGTEAAE